MMTGWLAPRFNWEMGSPLPTRSKPSTSLGFNPSRQSLVGIACPPWLSHRCTMRLLDCKDGIRILKTVLIYFSDSAQARAVCTVTTCDNDGAEIRRRFEKMATGIYVCMFEKSQVVTLFAREL